MTEGRRFGRPRALLSKVRFGKFLSVGAIGAVVDTIVLVALTAGAGVLPELATVIGIETAILVMFLINERWTFADERTPGRGSILGRLKRSHVVRVGGSLTQFLVFIIIYRGLSVPLVLGDVGVLVAVSSAVGLPQTMATFDLWLLVAKATGIGVGVIVNYAAESLFTWRVGVEG